MKGLLLLIFTASISLSFGQQNGWQLLEKADSLIARNKTRRVPAILKKAQKADFGSCGISQGQGFLKMEGMWSRYYLAVGDTAQALSHSLPHVFNRLIGPTTELSDLAFSILLETCGSLELLQKDYLTALDSLPNISSGIPTLFGPYIVHLYGQDIEYYHLTLTMDQQQNCTEAVRKAIESTYFSRLILKE